MTLTREDVDRRLAELRRADAEISAAMYAIDTHPAHQLLRTGEFSGQTGKLWREVEPAVQVLWAQFTIWRELVDRAGEVRGRDERPGDAELAELELLLCEPVVGLDEAGHPTVGGQPPPRSRVTVDELAGRLRTSCESVTAGLERFAAAQHAVTERLAAAGTRLAEARTLADTLGSAADSDTASGLDVLGARLSELESRAVDDPLGMSADTEADQRLRRLATELDDAYGRLRALDRFREECPERVAALRTAVEGLATLETRVEEAYQVVHAKIATPGLPLPFAAVAGFRRRLDALDGVVAEQRWAGTEALVVELERAVAAEQARDERLLDAATGLLERRDELRGRLRAYQARAARLGIVEEPEVSTLYLKARDLLWSSPCDLRAATSAVRRYQESVSRTPTGQPPPGQSRQPQPGRPANGQRKEPT